MDKKLSDGEKRALNCLDVNTVVLDKDANKPRSLAGVAFKRFRYSQHSVSRKYVDSHSICPFSDRCERFFSVAKRSFSGERKAVTSCHVECATFLFANKDLWTIADVNAIVN